MLTDSSGSVIKSFSSNQIEVGTLLVLARNNINADPNEAFTGHLMTVVEFTRDSSGNKSGIWFLEGHQSSGGQDKSANYIWLPVNYVHNEGPHGSDLSIVGFGEIEPE